MAIRRWTTSPLTLTIDQTGLNADDMHITFRQGDYVVDFTGTDIVLAEEDDVTKATVLFTPAETGGFLAGEKVEVQININEDGDRYATCIKTMYVTDNIYDMNMEEIGG